MKTRQLALLGGLVMMFPSHSPYDSLTRAPLTTGNNGPPPPLGLLLRYSQLHSSPSLWPSLFSWTADDESHMAGDAALLVASLLILPARSPPPSPPHTFPPFFSPRKVNERWPCVCRGSPGRRLLHVACNNDEQTVHYLRQGLISLPSPVASWTYLRLLIFYLFSLCQGVGRGCVRVWRVRRGV